MLKKFRIRTMHAQFKLDNIYTCKYTFITIFPWRCPLKRNSRLDWKTDDEGRYCEDFSIACELTKITEDHTRISDVTEQQTNLLVLFLTSCSDKCCTIYLALVCTSDHSVISDPDLRFHRRVFRNA